jgi:S-DNA-T family DNA segregation ATPase FtsK/SpoIIIE
MRCRRSRSHQRRARATASRPRPEIEENAESLESVLEDFGVRGEIINARPGPVVTLYELEPAPGIKSSRVIGLADDIARSMSALSARVAVVSGPQRHRHRVAERQREKVYFARLLTSDDYTDHRASCRCASARPSAASR